MRQPMTSEENIGAAFDRQYDRAKALEADLAEAINLLRAFCTVERDEWQDVDTDARDFLARMEKP